MISLKSVAITLFALSRFPSTHSQPYEPEDQTFAFLQSHPARVVFTPRETQLLRSADAITLTPLEFENKIFDSWMKGRSDAMKDLAKNATATSFGLNVETILEKNEENKLGMTLAQIENQIAFAYQLGGLHSVNNVLRASGRSIDVPKMRMATPEEYHFMRMREQEILNRMMRGMRAQKQKLRQRSQFGIRQSLGMRMGPSVTDADDTTYRQVHYSPIEVGSVGTESEISLSPFERLSPSHYSPVDQSSIEPSITHYETNEPQIVLLRPVELSPVEQSEVESAENS